MPRWLVRATWIEDDVEASEQWEVEADTAHDAVRDVSVHVRFPPHHVEAKLAPPDQAAAAHPLRRGEPRRIPG